MISVTELRAGTTFEMDGKPFIVLKYEHTKVGRGTANIKLKIKNLKSKIIIEKTFNSGARVEPILTSRKKYQYLYQQGEEFYFMDPHSFEQITLGREVLQDQTNYLKKGMIVELVFLEDKPLSVELPQKMEFTVAETGPGVKGNSAVNIYKPATLDNGLKIKIPLFVDTGDKILVDTRTGEYVERVK